MFFEVIQRQNTCLTSFTHKKFNQSEGGRGRKDKLFFRRFFRPGAGHPAAHGDSGNSPEITIDDCRAIVSRTPEAVIWEYTDAIQNGRKNEALNTLALLSSQHEPGMELKLIYMLSNAYQKSLNCRLAMQELGIRHPTPAAFENLSQEIKAKYPNNPLIKLHPFRAYKMCEAAAKLDGASLAAKLTLIRNANRALVSGGGDAGIILEQLTLKLC